jgi:cytochrome P450
MQMVVDHVRKVAKEHGEKEIVEHNTIFSEILESNLPDEEKQIKRLGDEACVMVGAGSDTIKHTLTIACYYILNDQKIYERLVDELVTAIPDRNSTVAWAELEKLPYLTAIIQECTHPLKLTALHGLQANDFRSALRLSYGVTQRSPRLSPTEAIQYKDYTIPPGFAIGMDPVHMHHNEEIFPDSYAFKPERWLGDPIDMKKLQRYNIAFSKGTRQCLGLNLAWAEIYLLLSTVFRRFEMELYETDASCVQIEADFFLPKMKNKEGLKVMIKKREK